ncbi:MAG: hypothetical protein KAQ64_00835 [Candidatus Pacebacteria bacterium]|nr:hypothetical protein [Candidatus Paceibacterota bacterium]
MTINRKVSSVAVIVLGIFITLVGTVMSSSLELGIVNGSGIVLVFLSTRALRTQENFEFINTKIAPERWTFAKMRFGIILIVIGFISAITAAIIIGTAINIATATGLCVLLLGAGKTLKVRALRNHSESVTWAMRLIGYPAALIFRAQSMAKRPRVAA